MSIALGIDTGGTFTDAVLVDHTSGRVLAGAKALTTHHNLAIGIDEAIGNVFAVAQHLYAPLSMQDISLVALSTTLATNALAEGQRGAICLILIGYDAELIERFGFRRELATDDVVYVQGGHDSLGNEAAPLDEEAVRAAIQQRQGKVEAFAVSGYFAVRNPAHEVRVRALVEEMTGLPVTCGHELTSRLDAVRRATTVALNAHLILPLRRLIAAVDSRLRARGISAPLMVVKGDGSLVRASWAMQRPIETVLSGPAASVMGALHLARQQNGWVVDIGGTTTDIAALRHGFPVLNADGASVGGWRTMIEAVDVHTTGLGGDSQVWLDREARLHIGPRRVVPLSLLASEYPAIIADLQRFVDLPRHRRPEGAGEFLMVGRPLEVILAYDDQQLLEQLSAGPQSLASFLQDTQRGWLLGRHIRQLETRGFVQRAGFTPSDALHVLGRFTCWNAEAARLGACLLADKVGVSVTELCEKVVQTVSKKISMELVTKVLSDGSERAAGQNIADCILLQRALDGHQEDSLQCILRLQQPLIAIGAPVAAYMPAVADLLHTQLVIPPFAEVANAIGAVAGGVVQRVHVLINPLDDTGRVRVHLPNGIQDADDLESAVFHAQHVVQPHVEALARRAGADQVEVHMTRHDRRAPTSRGSGEEIYLGTELTFTAVGRPSIAQRKV